MPARPPATTQFGAVVPDSVAQTLSCVADITAIVTGPNGEPLQLGRSSRLATPAQRQALKLRDKHCRFPGCDRPWCIVHHAKPWALGGTTDIDTMVLLCEEHHAVVHRDDWVIVRLPDGTYTAQPPMPPTGSAEPPF